MDFRNCCYYRGCLYRLWRTVVADAPGTLPPVAQFPRDSSGWHGYSFHGTHADRTLRWKGPDRLINYRGSNIFRSTLLPSDFSMEIVDNVDVKYREDCHISVKRAATIYIHGSYHLFPWK